MPFHLYVTKSGFRIRIFLADPDQGKNLHADPGGIRGVKGKNYLFFEVFFTFQMILNNFFYLLYKIMIYSFLSLLARIRIRIFLRIRTGQKHADPDPKP